MNDLNSVYLVGKLKAKPEIDESKKFATFTLINSEFRYDETSKEYVNHKYSFFVKFSCTDHDLERVFPKLTAGVRVGVNGRLIPEGEKVSILTNVIQLLG